MTDMQNDNLFLNLTTFVESLRETSGGQPQGIYTCIQINSATQKKEWVKHQSEMHKTELLGVIAG